MFGKRKMSGNDRFVMQAGRDVGNLKGRGTAKKTAPLKTPPPTKSGSVDKLTGPSKDKGMSVGQQGTMLHSTSRRVRK